MTKTERRDLWLMFLHRAWSYLDSGRRGYLPTEEDRNAVARHITHTADLYLAAAIAREPSWLIWHPASEIFGEVTEEGSWWWMRKGPTLPPVVVRLFLYPGEGVVRYCATDGANDLVAPAWELAGPLALVEPRP